MRIYDINSLCADAIFVFGMVCFPLTDALSKIQEISNGLKCIWGHLHRVEDNERDSLVRYLGLVVKAFEEQDEVYLEMSSSNQETMDKMRPYINELQERILTYKAEKTAVKDTDTENSQESQERADFRLKYDRYISNIDIFFESLKTIKVRELKAFFDKSFAKSNVTLKNFFDDCAAIVPERKGERGWKYNNIKNFNTR